MSLSKSITHSLVHPISCITSRHNRIACIRDLSSIGDRDRTQWYSQYGKLPSTTSAHRQLRYWMACAFVQRSDSKVVRIAHLVIAEADRTLQRYYPLKALGFRLSLGQPLPVSTGSYSALMPEWETMAVLETKRAFALLLNPTFVMANISLHQGLHALVLLVPGWININRGSVNQPNWQFLQIPTVNLVCSFQTLSEIQSAKPWGCT